MQFFCLHEIFCIIGSNTRYAEQRIDGVTSVTWLVVCRLGHYNGVVAALLRQLLCWRWPKSHFIILSTEYSKTFNFDNSIQNCSYYNIIIIFILKNKIHYHTTYRNLFILLQNKVISKLNETSLSTLLSFENNADNV